MNINVSNRGWLYNAVYWNRDHRPTNTTFCLFCWDAFVGTTLFLFLVLVGIFLGSYRAIQTAWYFLMNAEWPQGIEGFWHQFYRPIHFWPKRKGENIPPLFFLSGLLILGIWSFVVYGYYKANRGATQIFGSTELAAFLSKEWIGLTRFTADIWTFVQDHWLAILLSVAFICCLLAIKWIVAVLAIPFSFVGEKIKGAIHSPRWRSRIATLATSVKSVKQKLCPTITFVP